MNMGFMEGFYGRVFAESFDTVTGDRDKPEYLHYLGYTYISWLTL